MVSTLPQKSLSGVITSEDKLVEKPGIDLLVELGWIHGTHPTSAVLSDGWYLAKRVTLSLALRSSGDAGRGFGRVGAAAALVAG
jgi:hypothetical protein